MSTNNKEFVAVLKFKTKKGIRSNNGIEKELLTFSVRLVDPKNNVNVYIKDLMTKKDTAPRNTTHRLAMPISGEVIDSGEIKKHIEDNLPKYLYPCVIYSSRNRDGFAWKVFNIATKYLNGEIEVIATFE